VDLSIIKLQFHLARSFSSSFLISLRSSSLWMVPFFSRTLIRASRACPELIEGTAASPEWSGADAAPVFGSVFSGARDGVAWRSLPPYVGEYYKGTTNLTHIIHEFQINRNRTRLGIVFERILLPIFLQHGFLGSRGKSLGVSNAFGTRMSENTVPGLILPWLMNNVC
jgi:hypothetical protein